MILGHQWPPGDPVFYHGVPIAPSIHEIALGSAHLSGDKRAQDDLATYPRQPARHRAARASLSKPLGPPVSTWLTRLVLASLFGAFYRARSVPKVPAFGVTGPGGAVLPVGTASATGDGRTAIILAPISGQLSGGDSVGFRVLSSNSRYRALPALRPLPLAAVELASLLDLPLDSACCRARCRSKSSCRCIARSCVVSAWSCRRCWVCRSILMLPARPPTAPPMSMADGSSPKMARPPGAQRGTPDGPDAGTAVAFTCGDGQAERDGKQHGSAAPRTGFLRPSHRDCPSSAVTD